ncbi:HD domain-containing protein [Bacillus timonensis]|nr:HD domain-containing protein [Bacillus timonensis]
MSIYQQFVKRLIRNYLIGSVIAVVGVGGIFMFSTLQIPMIEQTYLAVVLITSLLIMCVIEMTVFIQHLKPIKKVFHTEMPTFENIKTAYNQTHQFPLLTVKRILGPHLLGISVPAISMTSALIYYEYISLTNRYILYAIIGAILVATMHALIEFFLTSKAIQPILYHIRQLGIKRHKKWISLNGEVLVSIQKKFQFSAIFIGIFPLLLFSLASQVRLSDMSKAEFYEYWSWGLVIILISTLCASLGAYLLFKNIAQPIIQLQENMKDVEEGKFEYSEDIYSDEFSRLVTGFNMMVQSITERDHLNQQLLDSFYSTLAATLDARDPYTAGHSVRVADYSVKIAKKAGFSQDEVERLRKSALLHDIGKIGIRDQILLKDGRLTDEEYAIIKTHPTVGAKILEQIQPSEAMAPLIPGVKYHHERYDGKGYPEGLIGDDIPIFGRIMAVADAFDAMTSDRPYRKGMEIQKAISIIEEGKGTQWDPFFASIFIELIKEQTHIQEEQSLLQKKAD